MVKRAGKRTPVLAPVVFFTLALAVSPGQAVFAQDREDPGRAEDMAREGVERIMRALELFMDSIPQYELPEINEHGDIIIKRKRGHEKRKPDKPESEPDAADT